MDEASLPEKKQFARVAVTGKTAAVWASLQQKLMQAVIELLDAVVDDKRGTTVRDEAQHLATALLDYAKANLARPGLENERIDAEVRRLYGQMEIDRAEARKKHAEADTLEFNNKMRQLRVALGLAKVLMIGDTDEEAIIFTTQVTAFLEMLEKLPS